MGSPAVAAGGAIKIGIIEPLTGSFANLGKDNEDGFNLYLASINSTVAGRKIDPIFVDAQAKPDVGLTKAKQLVESDKAQILMGITATPVCYAVAQYVQMAHVPLAVTGNCGGQSLMLDPKFKSPYLVRFTQVGTQVNDVVADWSYKQGYRKAILLTSDYGGGLEGGDDAASAFVDRGGAIVQEFHPAVGTTDFGPFLAQLDPSADVLFAFLAGSDALRFGEQYGTYTSGRKLQVAEPFGAITAGPNLIQLKDKAVGIVAANLYSEAIDTPMNQAFLKAFHAKYPGRLMSNDVAQGYAGAQLLAAALQKVNGNIEDQAKFMAALYATDAQTVKGPVKLDKDHDVIQNIYVYRTVKQGSGFGQQLLQTYDQLAPLWDRTPAQFAKLPVGKMKGKWVGMTKAKLDALTS